MEGSFVLCGAYVMEEDGGFSDPRDVLVEGGIIRAITSGGRLPRDAARYDCRGLWLMPGVFDCHAHVGMSIDDAWENHNTPYSLRVLQTAGNLRTMLHSGVTFVRDAGGTDAGVRAALAQGEIEGPDLQVSVNLLCQITPEPLLFGGEKCFHCGCFHGVIHPVPFSQQQFIQIEIRPAHIVGKPMGNPPLLEAQGFIQLLGRGVAGQGI